MDITKGVSYVRHPLNIKQEIKEGSQESCRTEQELILLNVMEQANH
jgi:hypothetical protein